MPTRFRRTIQILPGVKANISKGGVSFTVGAKGYHLNFSRRGVRQTVGLPGSGLSHTSYLVKNDPQKETKEQETDGERTERAHSEEESVKQEAREEHQETRRKGSPAWVLLLGILVIYIGALLLGLIPMNFLSQMLRLLTEWTRSLGL